MPKQLNWSYNNKNCRFKIEIYNLELDVNIINYVALLLTSSLEAEVINTFQMANLMCELVTMLQSIVPNASCTTINCPITYLRTWYPRYQRSMLQLFCDSDAQYSIRRLKTDETFSLVRVHCLLRWRGHTASLKCRSNVTRSEQRFVTSNVSGGVWQVFSVPATLVSGLSQYITW